MKKITQKEKKEICRFRDMFPHKIAVSVHHSDDGGFCAEIVNFPGCLTQADTFSELIEMVNDCARTYFEVPEKYLCYMPNYLPPISVAQKFNVFPFTKLNQVLNLTTGNARELSVKITDCSGEKLLAIAWKCGFIDGKGKKHYKIKDRAGQFITTIPRGKRIKKETARGIIKRLNEFGAKIEIK